MAYECPSCGFWYADNCGGTLKEAEEAWREMLRAITDESGGLEET